MKKIDKKKLKKILINKYFIQFYIFLFFALLVGFFVDFGYMFAALFIYGIFLVSKQGAEENEKIISPKDRAMKQHEIESLEEEKAIIEMHIAETGDLEAKLKLNRLNKEISSLKSELDDSDSKKV